MPGRVVDKSVIHDYAPTKRSFGMPKSSVWKYNGFYKFKDSHEFDKSFSICK